MMESLLHHCFILFNNSGRSKRIRWILELVKIFSFLFERLFFSRKRPVKKLLIKLTAFHLKLTLLQNFLPHLSIFIQCFQNHWSFLFTEIFILLQKTIFSKRKIWVTIQNLKILIKVLQKILERDESRSILNAVKQIILTFLFFACFMMRSNY